MNDLEYLSKLAIQSHGVLTNSTLNKSNITERRIRTLLKNGILKKEHTGVYTLLGSNPTWHQKANIAIYSCGPKARLSHLSVLQLFDLVPINDRNKTIHVLNPRKDYRAQDMHFHRSISIRELDLNNQSFGIKHVTLERALIDSCGLLNERQLSFIFDTMLSKRLIDPDKINQLLKDLKPAPGRSPRKLIKLIESTTTTIGSVSVESQLEKRIEDILRRVSKYDLVRQYEVRTSTNLYRLDFAIPERKIAVEVDGFAFHKDRATFDHDRKRNSELAILGWTVLHFTSSMKDSDIRNMFKRVQAA